MHQRKERGREEGGTEGRAPPIVRVDIVVGGSGFGHQAPLARPSLPPSLARQGGEASGRVERESMTNFI